jgi:hypothetical protein
MSAKTLKRLELNYSGVRSRPFWDSITRLPNGKGRSYLYIMGCNLQDIEARTLRALNEACAAHAQRKGAKRKGR